MKKVKRIIAIGILGFVVSQQTLAAQQFMEVEKLVGQRQENGEIVFIGKVKYPERACNYSGDFPYALRYKGINPNYASYYTLKFEASSPRSPSFTEIQGNNSGRPLVWANGDSYLTLKLTFTPKGTGSYQDNIIRAGANPIDGELHIYCHFTGSAAEYGLWGAVNLGTANDVKIDETCSLALDADRTVRLEDIYLSNLISNGQVHGADFPIQLRCPNNATVKTAYIGYSDGGSPSNTGQILSTDQSVTGAAQNVGLKIYDQASPATPITYGQLPTTQFFTPTGSNITTFASVRAGQTYTKNYKVYYVKTNNAPTAGSVTGKLKYNIYYR
ncbi:fimbrial protein [Gallibacterium trehalosifermentans]|uniref:Fimbrial protein n=1 Tax=Gallibacterium trehalosifermentans TaxID=516935 RepID=A0ABV6GZT2_9PAST